MHDFWQIPAQPPLDLEHLGPWDQPLEGLAPHSRALRLRYSSLEHAGRPSSIFAVAALHPQSHQRPTVVLVHGGGAVHTSFKGWLTKPYLELGYNLLALDLPGKGFQRDASLSTGPDMSHDSVFVDGDLRQSYLFHAVAAVRRTLDAAESLGCATNTLLLEGWSWGGVISLLTAAADPRVTAVIAAFGSGALRQGRIAHDLARLAPAAQQRWRLALDPACQHYPPHLLAYLPTGANDSFFSLPDNLRTAHALAHRAHFLASPNKDHALDSPDALSLRRLGALLADHATPRWPRVESIAQHGDQLILTASGITGEVAWAVSDAPPNDLPAVDWTKVHWTLHTTPVTTSSAALDARLLRDHPWYATLTSPDGLRASTPLYLGPRALEV
ncbi:MAG: acetylxylan esterase [Phycisphaeraceae bacterium]|nr:acetylxylan esterase [Phycisphaeraceae bacterium]